MNTEDALIIGAVALGGFAIYRYFQKRPEVVEARQAGITERVTERIEYRDRRREDWQAWLENWANRNQKSVPSPTAPKITISQTTLDPARQKTGVPFMDYTPTPNTSTPTGPVWSSSPTITVQSQKQTENKNRGIQANGFKNAVKTIMRTTSPRIGGSVLTVKALFNKRATVR